MGKIKIHLIKCFFYEIVICFLFFVYLYPLKFIFFPWVSTRVMLGFIGIVYCLLNVVAGKIDLRKIGRKWVSVFGLLLSLLLVSCLTSAVNGVIDTDFSFYVCSIALILFAGYAVYTVVLKVIGDFTFRIISHYVIKVVVLQMLIALVIAFFPGFRDSLKNLLTGSCVPDFSDTFRLWGPGSHSFTAGVVNSFALFMIAINCKNARNRKKIYLFCCALLIAVVGSMMARTTVIGVAGACCILIYGTPVLIVVRNLFKYSIAILCVTYLILCVIPGNIQEERIEPYFKYGFEIYYNYIESGEVGTASTDELAEMKHTYPRNVKTWLIGDGRFIDPVNPELYYMHTDVGYARLLFYYGLIGCVLYFLCQFSLIKIASDCSDQQMKLFFVFLFFLLLLLNIKGFTDFTPWVGIFLFCTDRNNENLLANSAKQNSK